MGLINESSLLKLPSLSLYQGPWVGVGVGKVTLKLQTSITPVAIPAILIALLLSWEATVLKENPVWVTIIPTTKHMHIGLIQMVIIAHTGIFSQLLLARGRADVTRNMGFVWAILTWVLSPPLIYFFNFVGMSLAALLVSASGTYLFFRLRQEVDFSFAKNFTPYLVSSALSGILVFLTIRALPATLPVLIFTLSFGLLFYIVVIWFFIGREVFTNFRYLIFSLKRTSG